MVHGKIFIALDGMTRRGALLLTEKLSRSRYAHLIAGFKIHDLWDHCGPKIVRDLRKSGAKTIWLDLKLHDTPKTIGLRSLAARRAGADILSVHAGGGVHGMRAAVSSGLKIVAITVLTSLDKKEVQKIYASTPTHAVRRLFALAKESGAWGLVCSVKELEFLPKRAKMKIIVPGIQREKHAGGDQRRTGTPHETLSAGADYIVIGSALMETKDPLRALEQIGGMVNEERKNPPQAGY